MAYKLVSCGYSLDNRPAEPLLDDLRIFCHSKNDRERQALLSRKKTADLLAQCGRKHRHRALHKVNTRRPLPGVTIESRVGLDEERDIGDMHANIVRAVFVDSDGHGIVEVLSVLGIDGEDTLVAKVLTDVELAFRDTGRVVSDIKDHDLTTSDSRPRGGRQTFDNIVAELLRGEVAVLEKRTSLDLDVANRT